MSSSHSCKSEVSLYLYYCQCDSFPVVLQQKGVWVSRLGWRDLKYPKHSFSPNQL